MNLKNLNDQTLIEKTESLVRQERELLTAVLHHLREVDRRRLYPQFGYKSLFDFSVKRLGYPEDQAYRRISAMKLLRELPEIEEKINQGEISLTHIGLAQSLFKQEKKVQQKEMSSSEKLAVFEQIANKPVREAERITFALSSAPALAKPDRVHSISEDLVEMKFTASNEVVRKIECLKGWLAHSHPNLSLGELFEILCDLGLEEWNPAKTAARRKLRVIARPRVKVHLCGQKLPKSKTSHLEYPKTEAQIKREVFLKANSRCENCGSSHALEIDHTYPQAKGGDSTAENLRLLCRSCNQRAAIHQFGLSKMDSFLNAD
jgi:hypothetical protein